MRDVKYLFDLEVTTKKFGDDGSGFDLEVVNKNGVCYEDNIDISRIVLSLDAYHRNILLRTEVDDGKICSRITIETIVKILI